MSGSRSIVLSTFRLRWGAGPKPFSGVAYNPSEGFESCPPHDSQPTVPRPAPSEPEKDSIPSNFVLLVGQANRAAAPSGGSIHLGTEHVGL